MVGRRRGHGDDGALPGPGERRWIHPSELPSGLDVPPPSPPRRRLTVPLAGVAGALAALGLTALVASISGSDTTAASTTTALAGAAELPGPAGMPRLAAAAGPALVGVAAWTGPQVRYGSGIAYREDGLVVTVASLVEGTSGVEVTAADGRSAQAEVVGTDTENDLALLRADLDGLTTLGFADDAPVEVGQPCALLGAAHAGQESPWAAWGTVAAVGKVVATNRSWMVDVLEVDARLESTGVGGALLDGSGRLLAVLTDAGRDAVPGTLAVPVRTARRSVEQLVASGRVDHPWLGLATADATGPRGALVRAVEPGSPAATAGVLDGDVVVEVAGRPVKGTAALLREVRRHEVGDEVVLALVRDGGRLDLTVTLAPRPRATMGR